MAIAQVESLLDANNAVSASTTVTFAVQPSSGNTLLVAVACFFPDGTGQFTATAPSGLTLRENLDAAGSIAALLYSKVSNGADGTSVTGAKTGDNESIAVVAVDISGSNGYDVSGQASTASGTSLEVTCTATTNGSRAYAVFFPQNVSGGYTPTAPSGWTLLDEEHGATTTLVGAHLYYKDVDAGAVSATFSRTGGASRIKGFVMVVTPATVAPTVTVPGAQRYLLGVAEVVSGLAITSNESGDNVLTCTATAGTWTAPTPTGVDVSGSGTAEMTLTGTPTELNTYLQAGNGPAYTHSALNHTADTLTFEIDDQVNSPVSDTVAVTAIDARITASTVADLNATFQNLQLTEASAKDVVMTVYAEDNGGRTDSAQATITFVNPVIAGGLLTDAVKDFTEIVTVKG